MLSFLRLAGVPLVLWLILGPQADGLAVLVLALAGSPTGWTATWRGPGTRPPGSGRCSIRSPIASTFLLS